METRANHVLIGFFTLAVLAMGFFFTFWVSNAGKGSTRAQFDVVIEGSVSGLSVGSAVLFNGIKVGQVDSIKINPLSPTRVIARISVDQAVPVLSDTRAQLEYQGLTGVAAIQLKGGVADAPTIPPGPEGPPLIVADRSDVQNVLDGARTIMTRADTILDKVDKFINANEGGVSRSIANVETFTVKLNSGADDVLKLTREAGNIGTKIGDMSQKVGFLSERLEKMLSSIDNNKLARIVDNVDKVTTTINSNSEELVGLVKDVREAAKKLTDVAGKVQELSASTDKVIKAVDPAAVSRTMKNIEGVSQTLNNNREKIDSIIGDTSDFAKRLNNLSAQIEKAAASFSDFTKSPEGSNFLTEASQAAKSIRSLAEKLDSRANEIVTGLSRFSGKGVRDIEAFVIDGRKTINNLDRLLTNFERNPQRFIFGNSQIPEYTPRP